MLKGRNFKVFKYFLVTMFCFVLFFKLYLNMRMVWTTKTYFVFPYVSHYAVFSWLNDGPPDCTIICFILME